MTKTEKDIISAVINALGTIPTSGKENLAKLFNCIDALTTIISKEENLDECNDIDNSGCSAT